MKRRLSSYKFEGVLNPVRVLRPHIPSVTTHWSPPNSNPNITNYQSPTFTCHSLSSIPTKPSRNMHPKKIKHPISREPGMQACISQPISNVSRLKLLPLLLRLQPSPAPKRKNSMSRHSHYRMDTMAFEMQIH